MSLLFNINAARYKHLSHRSWKLIYKESNFLDQFIAKLLRFSLAARFRPIFVIREKTVAIPRTMCVTHEASSHESILVSLCANKTQFFITVSRWRLVNHLGCRTVRRNGSGAVWHAENRACSPTVKLHVGKAHRARSARALQTGLRNFDTSRGITTPHPLIKRAIKNIGRLKRSTFFLFTRS